MPERVTSNSLSRYIQNFIILVKEATNHCFT
nr:MAG TPA: hypothetical protein [Caudoviricetes sp.]DAW73170.1 MAG TPA: hypothetical protein [Caudoviricetes sp.]